MTADRQAHADAAERVVLVSPDDEALGEAPKLAVHRDGRLHRAVSVFVANRQGQLLLQRRAMGKYHSSGRWSNACCGHPRPGEHPAAAAARRLREEMGIDVTLHPVGTFVYSADVGSGLVEHEFDHLFLGISDATPVPEPDEVTAWRWIALSDLDRELAAEPGRFTAWLPFALDALRKGSGPAEPALSGDER